MNYCFFSAVFFTYLDPLYLPRYLEKKTEKRLVESFDIFYEENCVKKITTLEWFYKNDLGETAIAAVVATTVPLF